MRQDEPTRDLRMDAEKNDDKNDSVRKKNPAGGNSVGLTSQEIFLPGPIEPQFVKEKCHRGRSLSCPNSAIAAFEKFLLPLSDPWSRKI